MTADRKNTPDTDDFPKVRQSGGNGRGRRTDGSAGRTRGNFEAGLPSGREMEIRDLVEAVRALPDVRIEKVAAVRKAIESGTYVVDARKVAGKMIEELR